jgi:hypothetical protein
MKNESKTAAKWLQYAKKQGYDWADRAIYNLENVEWAWSQRGRNYPIERLSDATASFKWDKTTEGEDFWRSIYNELNRSDL